MITKHTLGKPVCILTQVKNLEGLKDVMIVSNRTQDLISFDSVLAKLTYLYFLQSNIQLLVYYLEVIHPGTCEFLITVTHLTIFYFFDISTCVGELLDSLLIDELYVDRIYDS